MEKLILWGFIQVGIVVLCGVSITYFLGEFVVLGFRAIAF